MFIPQTSTSIAEPTDVQDDELGYNIIHMYQLIGIISDESVSGLESILNYMNENLFSKDDQAINEDHYRITEKSNTTKRPITYTIHIKPKHIILKIIDIRMNTITIKSQCK